MRAFAGPHKDTFGLLLAVGMNGFAYFFSDKIALKSSGAQPVTREQAPRLYAVMERLAAKGSLPMPKLYVIPQAAPNAFATGRNPSHASVAATEGLLELMNDATSFQVITCTRAYYSFATTIFSPLYCCNWLEPSPDR